MIDIDKLTEKDIGRYIAYITRNDFEIGRLKSFRIGIDPDDPPSRVWVVYRPDGKWWMESEINRPAVSREGSFLDYTGQTADPSSLHFIQPKKECNRCLGFGYQIQMMPWGENARLCRCLLESLPKRGYSELYYESLDTAAMILRPIEDQDEYSKLMKIEI